MPDKSKTIVNLTFKTLNIQQKMVMVGPNHYLWEHLQKYHLSRTQIKKNIFGDGKIIAAIFNDKGKTGTITKTIFAKIMKLQWAEK